MGVKDLWKLLEPASEDLNLEDLRGMKVAVDASMWAHRFAAINKYAPKSDEGAARSLHVEHFTKNILKLLHYGIAPVFVFDGPAPLLKRKVMRKRAEEPEEKFSNVAQKLFKKSLVAGRKKKTKTFLDFIGKDSGYADSPASPPIKMADALKLFPKNQHKQPLSSEMRRNEAVSDDLSFNMSNFLTTSIGPSDIVRCKGEAPMQTEPSKFSAKSLHRFMEAVNFEQEKRAFAERSEDIFRMENAPNEIDTATFFRDKSDDIPLSKLKKNMLGRIKGKKNRFYYIGPVRGDAASQGQKEVPVWEQQEDDLQEADALPDVQKSVDAAFDVASSSSALSESSFSDPDEKDEQDLGIREDETANDLQAIKSDLSPNETESEDSSPDTANTQKDNFSPIDVIQDLDHCERDEYREKDDVKEEMSPINEVKPADAKQEKPDAVKLESDHDDDAWIEVPITDIPTLKTNESTSSTSPEIPKQVKDGQELAVVPTGLELTQAETQQEDIVVETTDNIDWTHLSHNVFSADSGASRREAPRAGLQSDAHRAISDLMTLCKLFGIPVLQSPGEAEAQCAYLDAQGMVDAIISDDSDVFLFGAKHVIRHFFHKKKALPQYFDTDKIQRTTGLDRADFISFAFLLGCDYMNGVRGIGIVKALPIIATYRQKAQEEVTTVEESVFESMHGLVSVLNAMAGDEELCEEYSKKLQALRKKGESALQGLYPDLKVDNPIKILRDSAFELLQRLVAVQCFSFDIPMNRILSESFAGIESPESASAGFRFILNAFCTPNIHRTMTSFSWSAPKWPKLSKYLHESCGNRYAGMAENLAILQKRFNHIDKTPGRALDRVSSGRIENYTLTCGPNYPQTVRKHMQVLKSIRTHKSEDVSLGSLWTWINHVLLNSRTSKDC